MTMVLSLFLFESKIQLYVFEPLANAFRGKPDHRSRQRGSVRAIRRNYSSFCPSKHLPRGFSVRAIGPSFSAPLHRRKERYAFFSKGGKTKKNRRRNPKKKKITFEIYPLPQRRERHGVRHGRFRASHGFREGRASGGNRGRRLDGKHIYE